MNKKKIKTGVITGNDVKNIFDYAKKNNFAIPAINCIGIDSINAVLEASNIMKSPVIIQFSYNGSSFIAGNVIKNKSKNKFLPSILGSIIGSIYIHKVSKYYDIPIMIHTDHCSKKLLPWLDGIINFENDYFRSNGVRLFSSHMIDLSNENLEENINLSLKYLEKLNDMSITLEIELGCTGGEEDGVDNSLISNNLLYTNPNDVLYAYKNFIKINKNFTIAASFGNVHGVYKPGNVKLDTSILKNSQSIVSKKFKTKKNPINFVFHGGSGSDEKYIKESISYGVVKMNIDTDIQWATWKGILDYYLKNKNFLHSQLGNINGSDLPNKKYYDPRVWIRESQISIIEMLKEKFRILNSINTI